MKAPLEFRIHGMDCADEVAILRREIVPLVGSPDRLGFDMPAAMRPLKRRTWH